MRLSVWHLREEDLYRDKVPFLPHQITRTRRQCDLPMLILTSSPSRGNVVRFFYCKVWLFCPLFHFTLFGRRWLCTAHPKEWGVVVHPKMEYPHELLGILLHRRFIFFPPFIYLFNHYLYPHGFMDIYFILWDYNPILLYLFSCSICSCIGHWEFFQLAPVSLWHTRSWCVLNNSLLSWFSRLILYIPVPALEWTISPEAWFLWSENGIGETKTWLSSWRIIVPWPSQLTDKEIYVYVLTHLYIHI